MALSKHYPSFLGASPRRDKARALLQQRVIRIIKPTQQPHIVTPDFAIDTEYATDVYQRMFIEEWQDLDLYRTVHMNGWLYSAVDPGDGTLPDEDSTWTVISASELLQFAGDTVKYVYQPRSTYSALDFIGLYSWVIQMPAKWRGPFTVIHELWGNLHRWTRSEPGAAGIPPATSTHPHGSADMKASDAALLKTSKQRGGIRG